MFPPSRSPPRRPAMPAKSAVTEADKSTYGLRSIKAVQRAAYYDFFQGKCCLTLGGLLAALDKSMASLAQVEEVRACIARAHACRRAPSVASAWTGCALHSEPQYSRMDLLFPCVRATVHAGP